MLVIFAFLDIIPLKKRIAKSDMGNPEAFCALGVKYNTSVTRQK